MATGVATSGRRRSSFTSALAPEPRVQDDGQRRAEDRLDGDGDDGEQERSVPTAARKRGSPSTRA